MLIFEWESMDIGGNVWTLHAAGQDSVSEQRYIAGGIPRADTARARHSRGVHPHPVAGTGRVRRRHGGQLVEEGLLLAAVAWLDSIESITNIKKFNVKI